MSTKNDTKEILETLNGLVGAVGSGFDKTDDKLGKIDGRLADHDQQFTEIRQQLDRIEHSILEQHARRIEALERKIGVHS